MLREWLSPSSSISTQGSFSFSYIFNHNIHTFEEHHLVVFSIIIKLCKHHYNLIPEHFHHPKRNCAPLSSFQSLPTQILVITNLLSHLPILNIWITHLDTYYTQPYASVFLQFPCLTIHQFLISYDRIILLCTDVSRYIYSSVNRYLCWLVF